MSPAEESSASASQRRRRERGARGSGRQKAAERIRGLKLKRDCAAKISRSTQAAAAFGVSASAASKDFSIAAIVSSVSSPMFEMRKVLPLSLP